MTEITLTTPALLFPAISLLLLAFTNRYLAIANLVRGLHAKYVESGDERIAGQISLLARRLWLIRYMQLLGVMSMFCSVGCMFFIFAGQNIWGSYSFGLALVLMMLSLSLSMREIHLSSNALRLQLSDMGKNLPSA